MIRTVLFILLALDAGLVASRISAGSAAVVPLPQASVSKMSLAEQLPLPGLWAGYKARFISPEGRVIDDVNKGISHSESQGYGLVLSVAASDPETFQHVWNWTRTNLMVRNDGLAAWRWDPAANPHVADQNNASDGDVLIAWALMEAGEAWNNDAYRTEARRLARAITTRLVTKDPSGWILKPGAVGFSGPDRQDGPVVNLSYWVFPAFERLAEIDAGPWTDLSESGLKLIELSRFGTRGLPTDWISLKGKKLTPANGFAPVFGYNAIRIPLYLAWGRIGQRKHLAPFTALWSHAAPAVIDVAQAKVTEPLPGVGYGSLEALTACASDGRRIPDDVRTAPPDHYYPTTLRLLVLIATHQRFPECW